MMEMASRLENVQMSRWFVAPSLTLLASKTDRGDALDLSSLFRFMGVRILEVKMSFWCMFVVIGFFKGS